MGKKTRVVRKTDTLNINDLLKLQKRGLDGLAKISEQYDIPALRAALDKAFNDFLEVHNRLDQCILFPTINDGELQAMLDGLQTDINLEGLLQELRDIDVEAMLRELDDVHPQT